MQAECRICRESCHEKDLVESCNCRGSLQYAHSACLSKWMTYSRRTTCEICHQRFPDYNLHAVLSLIVYAVLVIKPVLAGGLEAASVVIFLWPVALLFSSLWWLLAWLAWCVFAIWFVLCYGSWVEYFEYNCYGNELARFILITEGTLLTYRSLKLFGWLVRGQSTL